MSLAIRIGTVKHGKVVCLGSFYFVSLPLSSPNATQFVDEAPILIPTQQPAATISVQTP
jgi:hypothetical protein